MESPVSTGGVLPLPIEGNVVETDKLHITIGSDAVSAQRWTKTRNDKPSSVEALLAVGIRCWYCSKVFSESDGYFYREAFYCDACVWLLAENGEFYCG